MDSDLITTTEAARLLGISAVRMRQLVKAGYVPVTRIGRYNLIERADLAKLPERKPGRPVTTGAGLRRKDRRAPKQQEGEQP